MSFPSRGCLLLLSCGAFLLSAPFAIAADIAGTTTKASRPSVAVSDPWSSLAIAEATKIPLLPQRRAVLLQIALPNSDKPFAPEAIENLRTELDKTIPDKLMNDSERAAAFRDLSGLIRHYQHLYPDVASRKALAQKAQKIFDETSESKRMTEALSMAKFYALYDLDAAITLAESEKDARRRNSALYDVFLEIWSNPNAARLKQLEALVGRYKLEGEFSHITPHVVLTRTAGAWAATDNLENALAYCMKLPAEAPSPTSLSPRGQAYSQIVIGCIAGGDGENASKYAAELKTQWLGTQAFCLVADFYQSKNQKEKASVAIQSALDAAKTLTDPRQKKLAYSSLLNYCIRFDDLATAEQFWKDYEAGADSASLYSFMAMRLRNGAKELPELDKVVAKTPFDNAAAASLRAQLEKNRKGSAGKKLAEAQTAVRASLIESRNLPSDVRLVGLLLNIDTLENTAAFVKSLPSPEARARGYNAMAKAVSKWPPIAPQSRF